MRLVSGSLVPSHHKILFPSDCSCQLTTVWFLDLRLPNRKKIFADLLWETISVYEAAKGIEKLGGLREHRYKAKGKKHLALSIYSVVQWI